MGFLPRKHRLGHGMMQPSFGVEFWTIHRQDWRPIYGAPMRSPLFLYQAVRCEPTPAIGGSVMSRINDPELLDEIARAA
jgi:hypothetical protein